MLLLKLIKENGQILAQFSLFHYPNIHMYTEQVF